MTPERFARFDRALSAVDCDLYLSSSSADVHYLTGSEDGDAIVLYRPGAEPTVVVRAGGLNCVLDSAKGTSVHAFGVGESPAPVVADQIRRTSARRVAIGPLRGDVERQLSALLDSHALVATPRLGRDLRRVKEPDEIRAIAAAAACVGAGIEACFAAVRVGATDIEAAAAADAAARRQGAETIVFLQVKSGPRAAYSDAEAIGRPFQANEIGFIDMGVRHHHYLGDYTRAFVIGEPPPEAMRLVKLVDQFQREAVALLRPGLRCADFYRTVHQWFAAEGYPDAIPAHLGHGAGLGDDTLPSIVPTSEDTFVEGEVVCVEPGVYVRGLGGVRIEDTVVVRANGCEVLTLAPRISYRPA